MIEVPYLLAYGGTVLLAVLVAVVIFLFGEVRTLNMLIAVLLEQRDTWIKASRCEDFDE